MYKVALTQAHSSSTLNAFRRYTSPNPRDNQSRDVRHSERIRSQRTMGHQVLGKVEWSAIVMMLLTVVLGDLMFRGQSGGGEGAHRIQRPELDQCTVPEPRRSIHSREGLRLSHRCCVRRHPASPAGTAKRGHSGHNGDLAAQPDGGMDGCSGVWRGGHNRRESRKRLAVSLRNSRLYAGSVP